MLTEDYKPWLIEINSSPRMGSSTEKTSRLCHNVLEDTLKVVLDRKRDRSYDIGRYELAYKHPLVTVPPCTRRNLVVEGVQIKKPEENPCSENAFGLVALEGSTFSRFPPEKETHVICNEKVTYNSVETVNKTARNTRRPLTESNQEENPNLKPSNPAPVKNSVATENTDSNHVQVKTTAVVQKSPKSASGHSHHYLGNYRQSQHGRYSVRSRTETESNADVGQQPEQNGNRSSPQSPLLTPDISMSGSGAIPLIYASNLSTYKIVSRNSVSTNFTIPSTDNRDRPALSVNNVETTDLKTLKAQAKDQSCPPGNKTKLPAPIS